MFTVTRSVAHSSSTSLEQARWLRLRWVQYPWFPRRRRVLSVNSSLHTIHMPATDSWCSIAWPPKSKLQAGTAEGFESRHDAPQTQRGCPPPQPGSTSSTSGDRSPAEIEFGKIWISKKPYLVARISLNFLPQFNIVVVGLKHDGPTGQTTGHWRRQGGPGPPMAGQKKNFCFSAVNRTFYAVFRNVFFFRTIVEVSK